MILLLQILYLTGVFTLGIFFYISKKYYKEMAEELEPKHHKNLAKLSNKSTKELLVRALLWPVILVYTICGGK